MSTKISFFLKRISFILKLNNSNKNLFLLFICFYNNSTLHIFHMNVYFISPRFIIYKNLSIIKVRFVYVSIASYSNLKGLAKIEF